MTRSNQIFVKDGYYNRIRDNWRSHLDSNTPYTVVSSDANSYRVKEKVGDSLFSDYDIEIPRDMVISGK